MFVENCAYRSIWTHLILYIYFKSVEHINNDFGYGGGNESYNGEIMVLT